MRVREVNAANIAKSPRFLSFIVPRNHLKRNERMRIGLDVGGTKIVKAVGFAPKNALVALST